MVKILFVFMILSASSAQAQDLLTTTSTTFWASAVAADYVTTHKNMNAGFHEKAIHLAWLEQKPSTLVAFGIGIDASTYLLWYKVTEKHRVIRAIGLIAAGSFRLHLAMKNHRALKAGPPVRFPVVSGIRR